MANVTQVENDVGTVTASRTSEGSKVKRYNLSLPNTLFDTIQSIADEEGTTMLEVLRRFIKLGLIAHQISKEPDSKLIVRQGDKERELVLL